LCGGPGANVHRDISQTETLCDVLSVLFCMLTFLALEALLHRRGDLNDLIY